jgi:peptidoglycan/LPS O-acetylase OafA/YrhL
VEGSACALEGRDRKVHLLVSLLVLSIALRLALIKLGLGLTFAVLTLPIAGEYLVWGALAAWLLSERKLDAYPALPMALGGAVLAILSIHLGKPDAYYEVAHFFPRLNQTAIAVGFAATVVGVWRLRPESALHRILGWRPFSFFGKISYGLYLVHLFTWAPVARWFGVEGLSHRVDVFFVRLALSLVAGTVLWFAYEGPINNIKKRFAV